jgi:hypothetical protein
MRSQPSFDLGKLLGCSIVLLVFAGAWAFLIALVMWLFSHWR